MRRAVVLALFVVALLIFGLTSGGHSQPKDADGKPTLPPWFKKFDLDTDGQVNLWEWRHRGKNMHNFKKWDRDRDGLIAPEEALRTIAAEKKPLASPHAIPGKRDKKGKSKTVIDPLDTRPVVYRAGKLPKAVLPPWFNKLDNDNDGQVAPLGMA